MFERDFKSRGHHWRTGLLTTLSIGIELSALYRGAIKNQAADALQEHISGGISFTKLDNDYPEKMMFSDGQGGKINHGHEGVSDLFGILQQCDYTVESINRPAIETATVIKERTMRRATEETPTLQEPLQAQPSDLECLAAALILRLPPYHLRTTVKLL